MGLSTITINRGQGGLNQPLPGRDHVSAILLMEETLDLLNGADGLLSSDNVQAVKIFNVEEAEALGITSGSANGAVLYQHIRDFFLMAPGAELWVGECTTTNAATVTTGSWEDILTAAVEEFNDLTSGALRQMAIVHDTANTTDTIEATVLAALQLKLSNMEAADRPLLTLIGTIYAAGTATSGAPDLTSSDYERIVALSGSFTETAPSDTGTVNFAAPLGLVLGLVAAAAVHESIAWTGKFDGITGAGYLTPSHSSSVVDGLIDKGYLDFTTYNDLGGVYVAKSVTSAASDSDYNRIGRAHV